MTFSSLFCYHRLCIGAGAAAGLLARPFFPSLSISGYYDASQPPPPPVPAQDECRQVSFPPSALSLLKGIDMKY